MHTIHKSGINYQFHILSAPNSVFWIGRYERHIHEYRALRDCKSSGNRAKLQSYCGVLWPVRCTSFNLDSTLSTVPSVIFCHVTWQQCWQHAQGIFGLHEDHTCVCQFLKFICDSQRFNPLAIRHHNIMHGG